jgi:epoxide hydrolase 4
MEYEQQFITTNGVKLHVVMAGNPKGEPIIFLHGFPEFWYSWRKQIPFFVEKGYRVIVPDQRGYNLSEKPEEVSDYRISVLAKDINGLIDALGYDKVNLVGHDWGAAVAWWVATMFPERLKTLSILNVPYPSIMLKTFQGGNMAQLAKSWYMFFFQMPHLPEALAELIGYDKLAKGMQSNALPGSFTDEDLLKYEEAWKQPNALKSMVNWYRALLTNLGSFNKSDDSQSKQNATESKKLLPTPTLMLWGELDSVLDKSVAEPSIRLCADGELVFFPKSTHWIQHDEPDDVNKYIYEFLQEKNNANA